MSRRRGVRAGDLVDRRDRGQEAAGEDVLVDPRPGVPGREHPVVRHRDRLDPDAATGGEQPVDGAEVRRPVLVPDGLDHLHRHDGVVAALHVAVVAQLDGDLVGVPGRGDSLSREVELLLRERDRVHGRAASGRRGWRARPSRCRSRARGCPRRHRSGRAAARSCAPAPRRATRCRCPRAARPRGGRRGRPPRCRRARRSSSSSRRGTAGTGRWTGRSGARCCRGCCPRCSCGRGADGARRPRAGFCSGAGIRLGSSAASTVRKPPRSSASQAPVR